MSRYSYRDKVCVVTGAGSGIGAALAEELLARGARVLATDVNAAALASLRERNGGAGGRLETAVLDVRDYAVTCELTASLRARHGQVDVYVNNAGIGFAGEVRDSSPADWQRLVDINVMGVVNGIHAVYPAMVARGQGMIINMGSGAGLCPRPGMVPYAATKYAVVGLSASLRAEAAALGVRVCVACPGYIATGIMESTTYRGLDAARLRASIPLKPMTAQACARAVLDGAAANKAIVPVSAVIALEWWLYRWLPGLAQAVYAFRARKFRESRVGDTSAG